MKNKTRVYVVTNNYSVMLHDKLIAVEFAPMRYEPFHDESWVKMANAVLAPHDWENHPSQVKVINIAIEQGIPIYHSVKDLCRKQERFEPISGLDMIPKPVVEELSWILKVGAEKHNKAWDSHTRKHYEGALDRHLKKYLKGEARCKKDKQLHSIAIAIRALQIATEDLKEEAKEDLSNDTLLSPTNISNTSTKQHTAVS